MCFSFGVNQRKSKMYSGQVTREKILNNPNNNKSPEKGKKKRVKFISSSKSN